MDEQPIITVEALSRTYPGIVETPALKKVSFEIRRGEFVAIMGRSGSGKSTLLHQLSLLDTPTEGSIHIDGQDILQMNAAEKTQYRLQHLGYIFQEYALIVELSALENVYLPAMANNGDPAQYRERAAQLLQIVGLKDRLHHYPDELSGGEQQRVAIARSLINQPEVIFADEPSANLDTVASETVLKLFLKLQKEYQQTILMVTHEPDDRKYVDRIIWLQDGQIAKIEPGGRGERV